MNTYSKELSFNYSKNRQNLVATDSLVFDLLKEIGIIKKDILDLGCGDGSYSFSFLKLGASKVVGVDTSQDMIALANKKKGSFEGNIIFSVSDESHLNFVDDSFDIVFANFVLHHIVDSFDLLKAVYRVLKVGGYFLCTFSAYEIDKDWNKLINTEIPVRLGKGSDSFLVHNFIKPQKEIFDVLVENSFTIEKYDSVDNPDAVIDQSYPYRDKVKKLTILCLAKKE